MSLILRFLAGGLAGAALFLEVVDFFLEVVAVSKSESEVAGFSARLKVSSSEEDPLRFGSRDLVFTMLAVGR